MRGTRSGWRRPARVSVVRLSVEDAGELLTVQRSAYAEQAQLHADPHLPPLTQTLSQLRAELDDPAVTALGIRLPTRFGARLVAAVRLRRRADGRDGEVSRLVVVPDLQGQGLGSTLLGAVHDVVATAPGGPRCQLHLFTGEHSAANLRLYARHGYVETHRSDGPGYQLVHLVRRC